MGISRRHFMATLLLVALAHIFLVSWLTFPARPEPLPELPSPIQISLAPPAQQTVAVPQPIEQPEVVPEPPTPEPVIEPPPPRPQPVAEPQIPKPLPEPAVAPQPVVQPELSPTPPEVPVEPEPVLPQEPVQEAVAEVSAEVNTLQVDEQASSEYEQIIRALLEKHKEYPRRAYRMRIQGEALLALTLDRHGQPRSVSLQRDTGHRLLDKAVLAMVESAQPFPALPAGDPRDEVSLVVPVVFAPY